jgi:hypothetical protein
VSAAERIDRILTRKELASTAEGAHRWALLDGLIRDDLPWLLTTLQATAEAFSAQANYSLGTDWTAYVVDGAR